jgi:peptidoglycan/xylan/chitin deacetylase (PgdA/CDA1 family)
MYKCKFKWPGGAYIAVVFNMSWESWPDTLATSKSSEGHGGPPVDAHYNRGMRAIYEHAYAETGGMQRLLDVFKRNKIKGSCYADGLTVNLYPDLARQVRDNGHEFIVQGWTHETYTRMTVEEQQKSIDDTYAAFEKVLGIKATGFSSPGGNITSETIPFLAKRGYKYTCGMRNCDVPFIMNIDGHKMVGQTSYWISEFNTHHGWNAVSEVINRYKDAFDGMYAEGKRGFPMMLPYGTHPFLGTAFRAKPMEDLIKYIKKKPKVWITTRGEITDYMLTKYPDYTLDKFYPEAVASDRHYGLGIGLGGQEAQEKMARYRKAV